MYNDFSVRFEKATIILIRELALFGRNYNYILMKTSVILQPKLFPNHKLKNAFKYPPVYAQNSLFLSLY
jgi:hypothetical protein